MLCSYVVQLTVPPQWNEQTEINGTAWAMILALPNLSSVTFVVTVDEPATADREVCIISTSHAAIDQQTSFVMPSHDVDNLHMLQSRRIAAHGLYLI